MDVQAVTADSVPASIPVVLSVATVVTAPASEPQPLGSQPASDAAGSTTVAESEGAAAVGGSAAVDARVDSEVLPNSLLDTTSATSKAMSLPALMLPAQCLHDLCGHHGYAPTRDHCQQVAFGCICKHL